MLDSLSRFLNKTSNLPGFAEALPGREEAMTISNTHFVSGNPLKEPFPGNLKKIVFGLGCFWGAEKCFWQIDGVYTTAVGYAGGFTPNPTYEELCSGMTGHNEVVLVVFDPNIISFGSLLTLFWESHNPTQGMRQGNDTGTQYRSAIYFFDEEQKSQAESSKEAYQTKLIKAGYPEVTTEILAMREFYYAEEYHQQYLAKNPSGYCGLGGTGISCKN